MSRPLLILMKGMTGAGKTEMALYLANVLRYPLINKDSIADELGEWSPEATEISYNAMVNVAVMQLGLGLNVICDSPLRLASVYQRARTMAAQHNAVVAVVECHCSDVDAWYARIQARATMGLAAHRVTDLKGLAEHRARFERDAFPITGLHIVVDTACSLEQAGGEVVAWLRDLWLLAGST